MDGKQDLAGSRSVGSYQDDEMQSHKHNDSGHTHNHYSFKSGHDGNASGDYGGMAARQKPQTLERQTWGIQQIQVQVLAFQGMVRRQDQRMLVLFFVSKISIKF